MSLNLGTMFAAVALDPSNFNSGMAGLPLTAQSTFSQVQSLAARYLTIDSISNFVGAATRSFANAQEAANRFKYVYSDISYAASDAAADLEKTYGLATSTAKEMLSQSGDLLTGFGYQQREALKMSSEIAKRAIDVASFKGANQNDVNAAFTRALTGETESLKTYGIVVYAYTIYQG